LVEVARFQPTVGVTAAKLSRALEIPAPGERFAAGGLAFEAGERRLLVPTKRGQRSATAAGVLVSRHVAVESGESGD
jgi:rhodanese-related sulfurtransferase